MRTSKPWQSTKQAQSTTGRSYIWLRADPYTYWVHRVTSTYMFPFKEDLCRFDFEVEPEDEYMCNFIERSFVGKKQDSFIEGVLTPMDSDREVEVEVEGKQQS